MSKVAGTEPSGFTRFTVKSGPDCHPSSLQGDTSLFWVLRRLASIRDSVHMLARRPGPRRTQRSSSSP
ncbi:hypothetical protein CRUP_031611 [Coryphaenoides rupestris]|nr:hypothetical protein CRUP_031611 [Coryphaenoides rupestris]